jgi:hypothetical protein
MQRAAVLSTASLAPPHFSTLAHKRHDFRGGGGKSLKMKCVFSFSLQLVFETFLILRRIERDIVINVESLHVKCTLFVSDFNETWIFWTDLRKMSQISNLIKIRPVGAEFHAECQTDVRTCMTMLLVAFRNFANAPKNVHCCVTKFTYW